MPRTEVIRSIVKDLYPNMSWARQVDQMDDDQVVAIYLRNLENPPKLTPKEQPPAQGSLF